MTTKLKICGITRLEDARYAAAAGTDFLGFIQHEASPRYIEPGRVREIVDWVYGPSPVGVFVDATADEVNRLADAAGFELVQLHGNEPVFEVQRMERPVIKALRVSPDMTTDQLRRQLQEYEDVAEYFLLDTYSTEAHGGTGRTFDWTVAHGLADDYKIFLAGGIGVDNVRTGIRRIGPFAVDVSSSLESAPGQKDFSKIDEFMSAFGALSAE